MTAANQSSALKTGFKVGNKAIAKDAAIAMTKFGTRTLEIPLGPSLFALSGAGVALAEDGIFDGVTLPDANTGNMYVSFELPAEWDSTPTNLTFEIYWKSTATSGDAKFTVEVGAQTTGEDLAVTETLTVTTTVETTANKINKSSVTIAGSNLAAGDLISIHIQRDPTDVADDLGANVIVVGTILKFTGVA